MARLGKKDVVKRCNAGRFLILTYATEGKSYSLDNGVGVSAKAGEALTNQPDLFPAGDDYLIPNEDGLFPGFSQTWKAAH